MNVLFVCLGNICRSPMAEGLLKKLFAENNIKGRVDSAGFESFHINEPPDEGSVFVASKSGVDLTNMKARLFTADDFDAFDKIYVMDTQNMRDVRYVSRSKADMDKVEYLLNVLGEGDNKTVPDPYHSGINDCEHVFELIHLACKKIVELAKEKNSV
jgi:protein-tyrosine phosphatase